jgi:hypothetical protein
MECVGTRSAQLRAKLLKQLGMGQQLVLHTLRQPTELAVEFLVEQHFPWHMIIM